MGRQTNRQAQKSQETFLKIPQYTSCTQMAQFQMLSSVTYCVSERQQRSGSFPWDSKGKDVDTEDRLVIRAWKTRDVPGNSRAENSVSLLMMQRGERRKVFRHGGPASCRPGCFSSPKPILPGVCPGVVLLATSLLHQTLICPPTFSCHP